MATQITIVVGSVGENDRTSAGTLESLVNAKITELEAAFKIIVPPIAVTSIGGSAAIACITFADANG